MRALFSLLLIANAVMFAWIISDAPTRDAAAPALTRPGVDSIVLLGETGAGAAALIATAPPAPEPAATAAIEPEASATVETVAAPGAKAVAVVEAVADTAPAPAPVPGPVPAQPTERCYTVGPFRDLDALSELIQSIRDEVIEVSFRSSEEREQSLFWVYLAPEADLASARAMTRMLQQKKIKDFYIISEGDKQYGISLGHFREQTRAHRHRDRLAGLGFSPLVEPVFKNYTIYWLDYRLTTGRDISELLDAQDLDTSISHFDRACS